jgi:hypothetical protein
MPTKQPTCRNHKALGNTPMIGGKFSGRPLKAVPLDYLRWIDQSRTFDQATRWLVRRYLASIGGRRGELQRGRG